MNKPYFYEERGKTKKYLYCSRCPAGPFKQNEIDKTIHTVGQHFTLCDHCYKELQIGENSKKTKISKYMKTEPKSQEKDIKRLEVIPEHE